MRTFHTVEGKTRRQAERRRDALTRRTLDMLRLARAGAVRIANELAFPFGDPCIPGTQEEKSGPYNPTQLGKDFADLC
ncbi:hypothetical protein [Tractidigestivibacter scatoligenes]|uniref:hypothetical protein n=1 Tax=Tractidigestivibacter scatoligenes TaxID=1299998 RepID=UPI00128FA1C4|nr:hypothetical protein [Tractidigestivibacter scatoligenes]